MRLMLRLGFSNREGERYWTLSINNAHKGKEGKGGNKFLNLDSRGKMQRGRVRSRADFAKGGKGAQCLKRRNTGTIEQLFKAGSMWEVFVG